MAPEAQGQQKDNEENGKKKYKVGVRKRKYPVSIAHIHEMIDREPELSNMNPREIALQLGGDVSVSSVRAVRSMLKKHGYYVRRLDERVEAVLKDRKNGHHVVNGNNGKPIGMMDYYRQQMANSHVPA